MAGKKIMVTYRIFSPEKVIDVGHVDMLTGIYVSVDHVGRRVRIRGKAVRTVKEAAEFILDQGTPEFRAGGSYSVTHQAAFGNRIEELSFHPEGFSLPERRRLYGLLQ